MPNKGSLCGQWLLTWLLSGLVNLLLLLEAFQLRPSLYKEPHCKGFNHDGESSAFCGNHFFHCGDSTVAATFVLLRVLDILLLRKLKVRLTLYFSDSTLDGMMYLSHSSSSILFHGQRQSVSRRRVASASLIILCLRALIPNMRKRL